MSINWQIIFTTIIIIPIILIFFYIGILLRNSYGNDFPDEPPPEYITHWDHHPALGVIACYEMDTVRACWAHSVKMIESAPKCHSVQQIQNTLIFVTTGSHPWRYITNAEPTHIQIPLKSHRWHPLTDKTFSK
ncbi:MAG: hypothetical protein GWN01_02600 [Nitrosopumilaceae archaeon]|nr:hypothetical protein [Nitrosopumilaceae archaeon]NIT99857.1 hypothetical protein [Nitrosopumilaceae archaeon]NIU86220.1 hypothetical protein [Nitrosopumilaceae archaeon]NIV64981.1 hypothetical protein [Nitrosopumilaceae archaeon]NIX60460.1 hypothetical protein [Nitrosopumilaceae archaeon]